MDHHKENTKPQRSRKKLLFLALFASVGLFVLPIFFNQTIAQSVDKIEEKIEEIVERIEKKLVFSEERYWQVASDATTGAKFPTLGETVSESPWSDNTWTSPTNIFSYNAATASVTAPPFYTPYQTYVLKATGFDFSSIPDGSTIDGVIVRVNSWYRSGEGSGSMDLCQLLDTSKAKIGTNNCATPVALTTDDTTIITKGGSSDKWGNSLTAAWVKSSNFGVAIGILATAANADVDVDYVTVEIYYTLATAPAIDQNHYRWRNDTIGLNATSTASWLALEDTAATSTSPNDLVRLRMQITNTGTSSTDYKYQLEYAERTGATCGDETFTAVPTTTASAPFEITSSSQYSNYASTTENILTGSSTLTWVNGYGIEDSSNITPNQTNATGTYSEFEYAIKATENILGSSTYCFRLTDDGDADDFTYTKYPEIKTAKDGGRIWSSGFELQSTAGTDMEWTGSSAQSTLITTEIKRSGSASMRAGPFVSGLQQYFVYTLFVLIVAV